MGLRILGVIFGLAFCHLRTLWVNVAFLAGYLHVVGGIRLNELGDLAKIIDCHFSSTLKHSADPLIAMSTVAPFPGFLTLAIMILLRITFLCFLQIDLGSKVTFHTLSRSLIVGIGKTFEPISRNQLTMSHLLSLIDFR